MVDKSKHSTGDENLEAIQSTLSKSEQFLEENQKSIVIILSAIVLIVVGYMAYQKFYVEPMEDEAQSEMFMAQYYFSQDSFKLALDGDGFSEGFISIADNYGVTKAGALANCYAGISYLKLGDFDKAIDYLEDFDADDELVTTMAIGAIGDAYVEKGDIGKAVSYFKKAADRRDNDLLSPVFLFKLGLAYENLGQKEDAKNAFQTIKEDYPRSTEARNIDKYITRLEY